MARADYLVQQTDGQRHLAYDTTYFDTPTFEMYRQHQYNHANRQKIRFRTYVSSHLQFMEVKTKNNHGRTRKKRIQVDDMDLNDPTKRHFLQAHLRYEADTLRPTLNTRFRRITLVNKGMTERLTIDTDLTFHSLVGDGECQMGSLVIIELKRDGRCPSPVLAMLRHLRIHPHGFSKYCMGAALTCAQLPVNRFKEKLRDIDILLGHRH